MVANLTLGFANCGGASPSLSTAPICNLFIFVVSPSLLSFFSSAPVFSTGGSGMGVLTSGSSTLSLPPVTPGSFNAAGVPPH